MEWRNPPNEGKSHEILTEKERQNDGTVEQRKEKERQNDGTVEQRKFPRRRNYGRVECGKKSLEFLKDGMTENNPKLKPKRRNYKSHLSELGKVKEKKARSLRLLGFREIYTVPSFCRSIF